MNFYNPYFYSIPSSTTGGLLSRFSFGSLLNGASRVLNFANQAIPMVKQISPMFKNMKTMFQVMNEFKKTEIPSKVENHSIPTMSEVSSQPTFNGGPTFFI